MPRMRVVIDVSELDWNSIPEITREIGFPSDAQTPENVAKLFHYLLEYWRYAQVDPTIATPIEDSRDYKQALKDLLDPDIAIPIELRLNALNSVSPTDALAEFARLKERNPEDPWIILADSKENADDWRRALASTYAIITDPAERRQHSVWLLIGRYVDMISTRRG